MQWNRWAAAVLCAASLWGQLPKEGIPGACTPEQAAAVSGGWLKQPDNLSAMGQTGLTAPDRAALLAKSDKVLAILRAAYPAPRGVNVWHSRWAQGERFGSLFSFLSTYWIFMEYRCHPNYLGKGPRLIGEENSDAWIMVDFNWLGQSLQGELPSGYELPDGKPIFWTPVELGPPFRGVPTLKGLIETNTTTLFLSKDGRLPIRPVTREEILRVHAAFWRKAKLEEAAKFEKGVARDRELLAKPKNPSQREEVYARNQASLKERLEWGLGNQAKSREEADSIPRKVQAQIDAMSPAERRSQAVTGSPSTHTYMELQFSGVTGSRPLWTFDNAYFGQGTRGKVHFMTVFWRRVPSSKVKEAAFDEFLAKLDFEALRALIDR
ncbi:MAG: hypothetical protein HY821_03015 [Acidobacteria bacterium]|nr:hypothetical protein [Acidobacteriota bacterium]